MISFFKIYCITPYWDFYEELCMKYTHFQSSICIFNNINLIIYPVTFVVVDEYFYLIILSFQDIQESCGRAGCH